MFSIFKNKRIFTTLIVMILLIIGIIWGSLKGIEKFTRHGQAISVPDFTGLYFTELSQNPEFDLYRFQIIDSVYDPSKEKGSIIAQDPSPESLVKEGRSIYLTVVAINPKMVEMPELKDLTLRAATSLLQTYGLEVGKLSYVPDIAKNAVIEQQFRGEKIEPNAMIRVGSKIDLILGLGDAPELIPVPMLIGMNRAQAQQALINASLNLGVEHFDAGDDSNTVRVYRQAPHFTHKSVAKYGSTIELWYKSDANFDFDSYLQKLSKDSLSNETIDQP